MDEQKKKIKEEIRKSTAGYVMTALGLVAGLAWNEAIKAFIDFLFPLKQNTLLAKFIYALAITFFVVLASIYIAKFLGKKEEEDDKKIQ
ncbi:MAG: hypothetical protein HY764_01030 [Candidatus Portnoybacteria bacterium]|nr:hypothetical protein [Candidatus Portnoybacteria bacterium]